MFSLFSLLAARRSSEDDWMKVVFGGLVLLIWIAGAVISAINKRMEDAKRRQQRGQLPEDVRSRRQPKRARASVPLPPPPPRQPPRQPARRATLFPEQAPVPQPPPEPSSPGSMGSPRPAAVGASQPVAQASRVARLLRRPDSLRAGIILSEILGPPKGM